MKCFIKTLKLTTYLQSVREYEEAHRAWRLVLNYLFGKFGNNVCNNDNDMRDWDLTHIFMNGL